MSKNIPRKTLEMETLGSRSKLEVWSLVSERTIDPPQKFSQRQIITEAAGLPPQTVHKELGRLEEIGAIERREPYESSDRRVWYERTNSLWWEPIALMIKNFAEMYPESDE